jgi:hypothetical protein
MMSSPIAFGRGTLLNRHEGETAGQVAILRRGTRNVTPTVGNVLLFLIDFDCVRNVVAVRFDLSISNTIGHEAMNVAATYVEVNGGNGFNFPFDARPTVNHIDRNIIVMVDNDGLRWRRQGRF